MVSDEQEKRNVPLNSYSEELKKLNSAKKEKENGSSSVELFFSFDIVNSSSYKDMNYYSWPQVLTGLLRNVQKSVAKEIPEANLWRVIGDEVVFHVTIKEEREIYDVTDAIFLILNTNVIAIKTGAFFDELADTFNEKEILALKNQNIISLQAAAWIAIVSPKSNKGIGCYENICEKYKINGRDTILEFLGQDIDAGFRIKKETHERRMVISFELAYLLSRKTEYLSYLFIVTYKNLKGIWKNSLYPIIWYYNDKINQNIKFEDSFYYDELDYSVLIDVHRGNIDYIAKDDMKIGSLQCETNNSRLAPYMYSDVDKALNKVLMDRHLEGKIEQIYEVIEKTGIDTAVDYTIEDNKERLELHCAAVCCDVENRRIFIAKRANKKFEPGKWEFGCVKANVDEKIVDTLEREYKDDFGLDIQVLCDDKRKDKEPIPVAIYQVEKYKRMQKGIITVARIENECNGIHLTQCVKKEKHEMTRWITEAELMDFREPAVNDFVDTIQKVFEHWEDYFGEGRSNGRTE